MRIKLEWLKELVDLEGIETNEIVRKLSLYSVEVEGIDYAVSGTNLVVGHVDECLPHPNSDHLSVCTVDVGSETLQIVCGASNVRKGQTVIVAKIGAELPGGFKIKRTKIRGVESNGMICSLNELGLENKFIPEEYQNGIYYFKEKVEIGSDALIALHLDDEIIELDLTPNRGDLLSMIGVAIEASAIFNRSLKPLKYKLERKENNNDELEVVNEAPGCIGYYGQVVRNVEIKPSPLWLTSRLVAYGIRPINNVVDITNYILILFGQPLHAFDFNKLGNKIVIRNAFAGERITTLDEIERKLEEKDIVITDGKFPIAIAGVMGGEGTEITSETKDIVIEAAVFDSASVRATSQRLGLRSDSSIRFEKGVDINSTKLALDYTCYLLETLAGGETSTLVFAGKEEIPPKTITINEIDLEKLLGIKVKTEEIKNILSRLGFKTGGEVDLIVSVPNRRPDITITADLIEEIARIHGYEKISGTIPSTATLGGLSALQKQRREVRKILNGLGLNEVYTYSLVPEKDFSEFAFFNQKGKEISILMPITQDHKFLRKSLLPGLIENARYCYSRKNKDLAFFEIGNIYYQNDDYQEEEMLSLLMAGRFASTLWKGEEEKVDFFLIKGVLETLFKKLKMDVSFQVPTTPIKELHPGKSAEIIFEGEVIGFLGSLHPEYAKEDGLNDVYVAELRMSAILDRNLETVKFEEYSKVPSVERDIALVVAKDLPVGEILAEIKNIKGTLLSNITLFDIYTGEKVGSEEKSIAIKLEFSASETLSDEIINQKLNKILKRLEEKFKASLRS